MRILTIVGAYDGADLKRCAERLSAAPGAVAERERVLHLDGDGHAEHAGGDDKLERVSDELLARARAGDKDGMEICVLTAHHDSAKRLPVLCAAADLVVILVDGTDTRDDGARRTAAMAADMGVDVAFLIANRALQEVNEDLLLGLVQHGPVVPAAWPDETAADADAALREIWRFLDTRMPRDRKYRGAARDLLDEEPADRRVYRRWRLSWPAHLADVGSVEIRDISGTGISFESDAQLEPEQTIQLSVASVGPLEAKVVWHRDGRTGARFLITEDTAQRLASKLQRLVDAKRKEWLRDRRSPPKGGTPPKKEPLLPRRPATAEPDGPSPQAPAPAQLAGRERAPRVVAVLNTKGGTGKSTVCIHLAMALLHAGEEVIGVDLDREQGTFAAFAARRADSADAEGLPSLRVVRPGRGESFDAARIARDSGMSAPILVVDTPGQRFGDVRRVLQTAGSVVIPVNDSFIDLDVLGAAGDGPRASGRLPGFLTSLRELAGRRLEHGDAALFLLRNRLSPLLSRNKARMADAVTELCESHGARQGNALSERVIYRELFPKGMTVFDVGRTKKTRLTMSHLAARQEVRALATAVMQPFSEREPERDRLAADAGSGKVDAGGADA